MSNFNKLIDTARKKKQYQNKNVPDIIPDNKLDVDSSIVDSQLLEDEIFREQDPLYLAEKERLAIIAQQNIESPFLHPCQNVNNTVTLVSVDKYHEIDIEFNRQNRTAMLNIIRVDSKNRDSFIQLLHTVHSYLQEEKIEKVYQNIVISDWDTHLSKFDEFSFVRLVNSKISIFPFVIVETNVKDIVSGISKAMGMNVNSHQDSEDLDKTS